MAGIDRNEVRARLDGVIAAMKANGVWEIERPADDKLVDMGAFGTRTMAFEQWLRWVFVPTVEQRIAADGPWPRESHVAAQAAREHGWGGGDAIGALVAPLHAFDALFTPPPAITSGASRRSAASTNPSRTRISCAPSVALSNAFRRPRWRCRRRAAVRPRRTFSRRRHPQARTRVLEFPRRDHGTCDRDVPIRRVRSSDSGHGISQR